MVYAIIFEFLVVFFQSAYSFQILHGYDEDIFAARDSSVTIYAQVDSYFRSCNLKINGAQICQMTWVKSSLSIYHYEKMSCTQKFNHSTYSGGGSFYDCKFVVPNLQENGNKNKLLLYLNSSIMIFYTLLIFFLYRFWSVVFGTDRLEPKTSHHQKHQHLSS
jgi:hypothetical protein